MQLRVGTDIPIRLVHDVVKVGQSEQLRPAAAVTAWPPAPPRPSPVPRVAPPRGFVVAAVPVSLSPGSVCDEKARGGAAGGNNAPRSEAAKGQGGGRRRAATRGTGEGRGGQGACLSP